MDRDATREVDDGAHERADDGRHDEEEARAPVHVVRDVDEPDGQRASAPWSGEAPWSRPPNIATPAIESSRAMAQGNGHPRRMPSSATAAANGTWMTTVTSVTMRRNVIMRGRWPMARVARRGGGALDGPRRSEPSKTTWAACQPPSIFRSFSLFVTPTCWAACAPFLKTMRVGTLTHAELRRDPGRLVDVDLADRVLADVLVSELLDDRSERLAGATPRGAKVDQHRVARSC